VTVIGVYLLAEGINKAMATRKDAP